jgi:hypothetical protein
LDAAETRIRSVRMRIESDGKSKGNPRLYELIEHAPKTGKSPTVWAWPELIDYLKIAGQPVSGPWPPHQEPRPAGAATQSAAPASQASTPGEPVPDPDGLDVSDPGAGGTV